jgi:hypothetical protein
MKRIAGLIMILFGLSVQTALADIPGTINFQGRLTDTAGNAVVDGTYGVTFTLHYQATGNSPTGWSEVQNVSTQRGYFNIALGSSTTLNGLDFNYPYYLEIQVAGDAQPLNPRQPFSSIPYAMRAKNADAVADGVITTAKITDGAVTSVKIMNGTITSADVAGATITGSNIASGTITAGNIANATITGGKIASATITSTNIANSAIDTQAKAPWAPIVNGGINNPKIAYGIATTNSSGSCTVSLASHGFTTTPSITCTVVTGAFVCRAIMVSSQSNSQFTVTVSDDTNNHNFAENFNWIAVGY